LRLLLRLGASAVVAIAITIPSAAVTVTVTVTIAVPVSPAAAAAAAALGAVFSAAAGGSDPVIIFAGLFLEVCDIEERIALQSDLHEGRLHARQHTRDPTLVNAADEGILVGALKENLYQLLVFKDGKFRFVAIR
jgi:hypothetical protein